MCLDTQTRYKMTTREETRNIKPLATNCHAWTQSAYCPYVLWYWFFEKQKLNVLEF